MGSQVDKINGLVGSIAVKAPCKVATTANITLSGTQTIDGVALTADATPRERVLVKDQTDDTENGIYDVNSGAWTRSFDFDGSRDAVDGTQVVISEGTVHTGYVYRLSATNPVAIGTDSLTFVAVDATVAAAAAAAAASATDAETAETNAETAETNAETAESNANSWAASASYWAGEADDSATAAAQAVARVTQRSAFRWEDVDEIHIGAGVYFHAGTVDQMVYWNSELLFEFAVNGDALGNSEWHYIYLDDSAIVTKGTALLDVTCFANYTGADDVPVWDPIKKGWYGTGVESAQTGDRCVFAVLTDISGDILEFYHDSDLVMFGDDIESYSNNNVNTSLVAVTLDAPSFCKKVLARFRGYYVDGESELSYQTYDATATVEHAVLRVAAGATIAYNILPVITDGDQKINIFNTASNGNTASVYTNGWYFPIGM